MELQFAAAKMVTEQLTFDKLWVGTTITHSFVVCVNGYEWSVQLTFGTDKCHCYVHPPYDSAFMDLEIGTFEFSLSDPDIVSKIESDIKQSINRGA